jgi:hypothetical protein
MSLVPWIVSTKSNRPQKKRRKLPLLTQAPQARIGILVLSTASSSVYMTFFLYSVSDKLSQLSLYESLDKSYQCSKLCFVRRILFHLLVVAVSRTYCRLGFWEVMQYTHRRCVVVFGHLTTIQSVWVNYSSESIDRFHTTTIIIILLSNHASTRGGIIAQQRIQLLQPITGLETTTKITKTK